MTFLTQVPATALPVREWSNRSELHKTVMALFPAELPGEPGERRSQSQILFRVDRGSRGVTVLISSGIAPSSLPLGAQTREISVPVFQEGQTVRFRVAVNAVKRLTEGKKRVATPAENVSEWLELRLAGALHTLQPLTHTNELGYLAQGKSRVPLSVDTLEGVASVENPEALTALILNGVGRAKAYGCGLLSVVG